MDDQLQVFKALSASLPALDEHQSFWWKVTGRHMAIMMHEAGYSVDRQIECLLFHRLTIVPSLGPRPTSTKPWFKSRVGSSAGDGTPIGYSWRWGVGNATPYIRNFVEPIGLLTGTPADPLNEVAMKEFLWKLSKVLPEADLSLFWKFAPYIRPNLTDEETRQKFTNSAMLMGLEMSPESNTFDIMGYLYPLVPAQISELLVNVMPKAMRAAYGADVCLDSLNAVRDFLATDPDGIQLIPRGTTAIDCCKPQDARVKCYVVTRNTCFDHIAAIMTLGGRKSVPAEMMGQLQKLWYALRGVKPDFPTSAQLPPTEESNGGVAASPYGASFYFDIQPGQPLPGVKAYFEVGKHAKSDMAAAEALTGFLENHGRGRHTGAFFNVLRSLASVEELETRRGVQGFISAAFKKDELDITSYLNPQIYGRFDDITTELEKSMIVRQRRSLFE